jgi:hypothetical protein
MREISGNSRAIWGENYRLKFNCQYILEICLKKRFTDGKSLKIQAPSKAASYIFTNSKPTTTEGLRLLVRWKM